MDHPDASPSDQQVHSDDDSDMIVVPRAVVVQESAAVTFAGDLVEAQPMEANMSELTNTIAETSPDSVVIKRRHAKFFVLLVGVIVVGLLVALTVAMATRGGQGK